MKKRKINQLLLIIPAMLLFFHGCEGYSEYKHEEERTKVETKTPAFNPEYFKDKNRQHIAVFFDIVNKKLQISSQPVQVRPGKMPYRPKAGGAVTVVYKDSEGKELGRYSTADPMLARSCDLEAGKGKHEKLIEKGAIEILLPYDTRIATLEITGADKKPRSFPISQKIKEGLRKRD